MPAQLEDENIEYFQWDDIQCYSLPVQDCDDIPGFRNS